MKKYDRQILKLTGSTKKENAENEFSSWVELGDAELEPKENNGWERKSHVNCKGWLIVGMDLGWVFLFLLSLGAKWQLRKRRNRDCLAMFKMF